MFFSKISKKISSSIILDLMSKYPNLSVFHKICIDISMNMFTWGKNNTPKVNKNLWTVINYCH